MTIVKAGEQAKRRFDERADGAWTRINVSKKQMRSTQSRKVY